MNKRKEPVPNKLRDYRLKAGLIQRQVAEMIGVNSQERISHWEHGRNLPSLLNLVKLSLVYNVQVNEMYNLQSLIPSDSSKLTIL